MEHPYRIREIAAQAGLSHATVDRVLHHRGGVRESTVRAVHQAIAALDHQRSSPPLPARTFTVDVIVHDPVRVERALRAELSGLRPAVIRPRFRPAADAIRELGRTRTQAVILQAPETPELIEAVGRLEIPVITFGTDLPASKRVAHVGPDDAEAGATAAYLVDQWLADRAGDVLVVGSAGPRVAGFRAELRNRAPNRRVLATGRVREELAVNPSIRAVYTPEGGRTAAVTAAFREAHRNYDVFVAHDLDDENAGLLREGHLSAVLHHDLRAGLREACLAILQSLGAVPGPVRCATSPVRIVTPLNL
ncbi:LacI family DNA-binding transcriptional regulator [Actinoplanes solisilvae]|uniref:LacI family DNA-binding transcriptional regulator n=1 Tax=Actinoplanes solisilvae TaxID=2486853 RepID=UPI000FD712D3|nr:LacI family DNA-binding transcriptional regulator [Actinoplanes solisilvae]